MILFIYKISLFIYKISLFIYKISLSIYKILYYDWYGRISFIDESSLISPVTTSYAPSIRSWNNFVDRDLSHIINLVYELREDIY